MKSLQEFPATVAVVYYKSIMSRKPLDINQELALGTKSPESVFACIFFCPHYEFLPD